MSKHLACGRNRGRALLLASTLLGSGLAAPALAQTAPPARFRLDANGIDLATGRHVQITPSLPIGQEASSLRLMRSYSHYVQLSGGIWSATTSAGDTRRSYTFTQSGSTFIPQTGEGATLVSTNPGYVLTLADGTEYTYGETTASSNQSYAKARLTKLKLPGGETLTMAYVSVTYCTNNLDNCQNGTYITKVRLQSVTSSYGYQLHYNYQNNQATTAAGGTNWDKLIGVTPIDLAVDYCDPAAATCTVSQPLPQATYSSSVSGQLSFSTVTDPLGRATRYTTDSTPGAQKFKIKRPSSSTDNIVVNYDSAGLASSVVVDGRTWTYAFSLAGALRTATITNPDNTTRIVVSDINVGLPVSVKDELNRTTSYTYDASGRLTRATAPEGNYVQYTYDARGNVTEERSVAKTPGTPADIVTTAGYAASCANAKTCNQPSWTKDAKGNQTDYTYDAAHGGVLTVTAPAPSSGAVRPQTRYGYSSLQAYYKNASGAIVASSAPVYRLTSISACQTQTSCTGSADETKTVVSYGPQSNGTANHLLPVSSSSGAGDGSLTATTTVAYDFIGNMISVDGPLAGTADTTRYVYDAARQMTMAVGADPDGSGALKNRAVKMQYTLDGLVSTQSFGTANPDGSGFAALQVGSSTYDASNRLTRSEVQNGSGTAYSVTQYSYDINGRLDCTALRMNTAVYSSLPTSACTAGSAGADGPDRISRNLYDASGRLASVTVALGTPEQSYDRQLTYTPNGLVQTATDGENNRTQYGYDGFDRLTVTSYPSVTKGANAANNNDFEQLTYDANGNVTQRRLRDEQTLSYTYDALDRRTLDDNPNTNVAEVDASYTYDNLGRLTRAGDQNGWFSAYEYDALGRTTRQYSNVSTNALQYDIAGRMTRQTWADGFYVTYDYLTTGELSVAKENGSFALASFGYDDLGRRVSLARGNGTTTSYSFDPVSRLAGLTQDLAGSAQDLTLGFAYNAAGQITSNTRSNDAYAWNGHTNVDRASNLNGLNQPSLIGTVTPTYDARGNMTGAGGQTYAFNTRNQLFQNGAGNLFYRNPIGLLNHIVVSGVATNFDYVGADVATEYQGATMRRYVHGPGVDEPLVWYEGSGTTDRRYLHADERGSIVAISNNAGTATAINRYDEYGQPATTNQGRFQYTGQKWISELGLYDYKARMYAPSLGRFMQTDPIGYGDGMNWYNYVGSDPVNFVDPTGLNDDVVVNGKRRRQNGADVLPRRGSASRGSGSNEGGGAGLDSGEVIGQEVVVTAPQSEDEEEMDDIVVTGTRQQPSFILIGGPGFDSGLPRDAQVLEDMLKDAKKAGDTELAKRIVRQQKMLGVRNANKLRGLGRFRIGPLLMITPVIEQQMHEFNCRMGINDGMSCGA